MDGWILLTLCIKVESRQLFYYSILHGTLDHVQQAAFCSRWDSKQLLGDTGMYIPKEEVVFKKKCGRLGLLDL